MNFNRTINLGAHQIKVETVPKNGLRNNSLFGRWDPDSNTISIADEMVVSRKIETLFHELFHAFMCGHDDKESTEELYAVNAGEGFAALLRYNPELIEDIVNFFKEEQHAGPSKDGNQGYDPDNYGGYDYLYGQRPAPPNDADA